ncbi:MAG: histidine ammonia-lyase [Elusimicrobia bacterium]|nr:histidine ammonia-lyase [Elusimicrobiota bacterium]
MIRTQRRQKFPLGNPLRHTDLISVACGRTHVYLPETSRHRMLRSLKFLRNSAAGRSLYGVNTGFGDLSLKRIPSHQLAQLQINLLRSHACGAGPPLSKEETRALMFLRANELARGFSGVRPTIVESLAGLLNRDLLPVVPSRGSVGASGDLAPLAHMALLLIGEGEARRYKNSSDFTSLSAKEALKKAHLKPLELEPKEGLALINGTQGMQACGALGLFRAQNILSAAHLAAAMSLEAVKGTPTAYDPLLQNLKPHPGQIRVARLLRAYLSQSEIRRSHLQNDPRIQDPYSLRCVPQVHGAVMEALGVARKILETEMNSITDNPVVFPARKQILSGGNFHGQILAMAYDLLAIAFTTLGNISERRLFQLVSGDPRILPPFLAKNSGLESGWMIAQVCAAALASENKILSHPASTDSIPTSGNKEDFVSMGMTAALKLKQILDHTSTILSTEILAAAQGIQFHRPLRPGKKIEKALKNLQRFISLSPGDASLTAPIARTAQLIEEGTLSTWLSN